MKNILAAGVMALAITSTANAAKREVTVSEFLMLPSQTQSFYLYGYSNAMNDLRDGMAIASHTQAMPNNCDGMTNSEISGFMLYQMRRMPPQTSLTVARTTSYVQLCLRK